MKTLIKPTTSHKSIAVQFVFYVITAILLPQGSSLASIENLSRLINPNSLRIEAINYGVLEARNQEFCASGNPAVIRFSLAPSGAIAFSYRWYYRNGIVAAPFGSSTTGWTALTATANIYYPAAGLNTSRTYACMVTPFGGSAAWASGVRQITVNTVPVITSISNGQRCGPGSVTLNASANVGTISWYKLLDGPSLGSGSTYTTPSLSESANYFVVARNGNCPASIAVSVKATINKFPTKTTELSEPVFYCGLGLPKLFAFTNQRAGQVIWYDAPIGGNSIDTVEINAFGTAIGTGPAITANSTFWFQIVSTAGCSSLVRYPFKVYYASPVDFGNVKAGNQVLIAPADPAPITAEGPAVLGIGSTEIFSWYHKDGIVSQPIGDNMTGWVADALNTVPYFDPPANLLQSRTYACRVRSVCGVGWANGVRQIIVTPQAFNPGVIAAGNQTICNAGDPGPISFASPASTGSTYLWFYQNGIVTAPSNAASTSAWVSTGISSPSYDPPAGLNTSRTYACRVSNGYSSQWSSGIRNVTVLPAFNPGSLMPDQSGCTGYNPVKITMSSNPVGAGAYNWRWYYWENSILPCPTGNTIPAGAITSTTDVRFFNSTPSTSGTSIFFDPISAGNNGRTWAVLIIPLANGTTPACGTARFASTCHRTLKSPGCREAVVEDFEDYPENEMQNSNLPFIGQNTPNPFSTETSIVYKLPDGASKSRIVVLSTDGRIESEFPLTGKGKHEISIDSKKLKAGIHFYFLEIDGIKTTSRKLVVQN